MPALSLLPSAALLLCALFACLLQTRLVLTQEAPPAVPGGNPLRGRQQCNFTLDACSSGVFVANPTAAAAIPAMPAICDASAATGTPSDCCRILHQCIHTCGMKKEQCEIRYRTCLTRKCENFEGRSVTPAEQRQRVKNLPRCRADAESKVLALSTDAACELFIAAQTAVCLCGEASAPDGVQSTDRENDAVVDAAADATHVQQQQHESGVHYSSHLNIETSSDISSEMKLEL